MGGLGVKLLRLKGRIEGFIDKLRRRARRDARTKAKARAAGHKPASLAALRSDDNASDGDSDEEEAAVQERILKQIRMRARRGRDGRGDRRRRVCLLSSACQKMVRQRKKRVGRCLSR